MAEDLDPPPLKRIKLTLEEVQNLSKEELTEKWQEQEALIDALMSKNRPVEDDEISSLRESEEKLKTQQTEASRRENVLVMRLTAKEQEMQDYVTQIQELKQAQNTSAAQLRTMLLDPAINIMFQRMKKEMDGSKEKLEQAQNDLAAWKFTPDSQTGKRLMAKCRMLLQENEELGKVISSGRTAKLEGEIALEKTLVQEMKKSQAEMDEFLLELDEDVEGMQSTVYLLQQQLKEAKDQIVQLQEENARLGGHHLDKKIDAASGIFEPSSSKLTGLHNALDAHTEQDDKDRTRVADEKLSSTDKAGYHRTSRQSSNSPSTEVVSNHKRDHQVGSRQDYLHKQTTRPTTTNGGHDHDEYQAMDTGEPAGFSRASCDADSTTGDHNTHKHFKGSLNSQTANDGNNAKGSSSSSVEVNNHHQPGDSFSDASYVVSEHTDAASSSEAWSPSSRHLKQTDDVEMEDVEIKSEIKGRTVGGSGKRGSSDDHQTLLQNGLVNTITPQFDSQTKDVVA